MAWTQDDLQSLEQLLDFKLKDKSTRPIEMNQPERKQQPAKQDEPEQGWIGRISGQLEIFGNWLNSPEMEDWVGFTFLLVQTLAAYFMVSVLVDNSVSTTTSIEPEKLQQSSPSTISKSTSLEITQWLCLVYGR